MKHLFILTAVAIAAAFGWRHLHNVALQTEQSRLNRSQSSSAEVTQPQSPALIDPSIPRNVVLRRQQVMKGFSTRLKSIDELIKRGNVDRTEIAAIAAEIAAEAQGLLTLFPQGTSYHDVSDPKTRARPEIWIENYKFQTSAEQLLAEVERLEQEAMGSGDARALSRQLVSVGRNACNNCHLNFRRPD